MNNIIPKIIHYCWFGGNPLPKSAIKCIESWKKFLPDYEIWAWCEINENDNLSFAPHNPKTGVPNVLNHNVSTLSDYADKVKTFDVTIIPYTREAYEAKKYAFVSDYARFWILFNYGGLYFDTDVEVIKPLDDIIAKGPFMGREAGSWMRSYGRPEGLAVAPGLGLGVGEGHSLYKHFLDVYKTLQFRLDDGSLNTKTICWYVTEILVKLGLSDNNKEVELVSGIWIYPPDVFCPMDHTKGNIVTITEHTRSIHRYDDSWSNHHTFRHQLHLLKNLLMQKFGADKVQKIINIFNIG